MILLQFPIKIAFIFKRGLPRRHVIINSLACAIIYRYIIEYIQIEYRFGKLRGRIIQCHIGHNLIVQTDSQRTQRKPAIIHNDDFINQMAIFIHFIHDRKYRCIISNM